jgi:hypothetical protein
MGSRARPPVSERVQRLGPQGSGGSRSAVARTGPDGPPVPSGSAVIGAHRRGSERDVSARTHSARGCPFPSVAGLTSVPHRRSIGVRDPDGPIGVEEITRRAPGDILV